MKEFEKLTKLFRTVHTTAKHTQPFSDFEWLCDLNLAKALDIGKTY